MLEIYLRGKTYWIRGSVEYNGTAVTSYKRQSTGTASRAGAEDFVRAVTEKEIRRHLLGDEHVISFADCILHYRASAETAKKLIPIVEQIGDLSVRSITPRFIRNLGRDMMPMVSTDTWTREIVTPIRAVINNAHDLLGPEKVQHIRVRNFDAEERAAQNTKRGSTGRKKHGRGSLEWLIAFRQHADPRVGALALFMFGTAARIGQAVAMHPDDFDLVRGTATIPAAKGHGPRKVELPPEIIVDLKRIKPKVPRGWEMTRANLRMFGYANRTAPRKAWQAAEEAAGIDHLPPHSAGRHGFGQEFRVRRKLDSRTVEAFGGWADTQILDKHYTGAEDATAKIHRAFRTSVVHAENKTGLKLLL